jgi:RNA methyltransferase, TrmH family
MALTQNRIKFLRSLAQKKFREENGCYLAEGYRLVREAVAAGAKVEELFYTRAFVAEQEKRLLIEHLRDTVRVTEVRDRDLEAFADTVTAQGVAALLRIEVKSAEALLGRGDAPALLVALDRVNDPGNLGSLIRTCDWFGVNGILLGRGSVDLYNPKVVRATMGGLFHLPIAADVDLPAGLSTAKAAGYRIHVADAGEGEDYRRLRYPRRVVIVLGNEAWGISDGVALCADGKVMIPRFGAGESLNVGVACGVILAELKRQQE